MPPSPDSDRATRVWRLFNEAVDLLPEVRTAFLAEHCSEDAELRRQVEALLQADRQADVAFYSLDHPLGTPTHQLAGRTITHYQITEKLGGGGMGVVYKAHDTRLDRTVALKFLSPHLIYNAAAKARFIQEAKAASALDHTNICTIHEIGETEEGQLFIAMACYEGETLKKKVARGRGSIGEALGYALQMAEGLARAHEAGIVHRDVKPANVMVTTQGRVKLLDFGLAKMEDQNLTRTGSVLGTLAYMSPEQIHGKQVDARTDVWSLGVVLYELLTGQRPFQGAYEQAIADAILYKEPEPLTALRSDVPSTLAHLVHSALIKKPDRRYQHAGALLPDLYALAEEYSDKEDAFVPPPARLQRTLAAPRTDNMVGRHVDAYTILRRLGEGGFGAVYLAERSDDQYRKYVVIKVVKRGMDSEEILRRFRSERQILASLDHPNIARLLDGGVTDDGRPYFVMDYLEGGLPIDQYCDQHGLSITKRLTLFRTACEAVHYAHQNLVVHRDLKPSNVLVSKKGQVKLLDFGIAKVLNPDLFAATVVMTRTENRLMTPRYAAPEQVRGGAITTASDVYSLGVMLYELLTGQRPYTFETMSPVVVERVVCEQIPERPSTVVGREEASHEATMTEKPARQKLKTQVERQRLLQGDLDTIVLKALRKEPIRRYGSAEQFGEDIRRHLVGLPVLARPDTWPYRVSKFVQRHTVGVTAIATIIFLLATGLAGMAWQAGIAREERDGARLEAAKSEQVTAFLMDLFEANAPSEALGKEISAREILEQGAARIETELADQPDVQATMMDVMGEVYRKMGLLDKAEPLLREALKTQKELLGEEHLDVARTMNHLGLLLNEQDDFEAAKALYLEALAIRRKALGDEHSMVLTSVNNLGQMLRDKGDVEASEPLLREALALRRKRFGHDHPKVAISLNNLAGLLEDKGDYDAAETLFRESLALRRKLYDEGHPSIATALNNLGLLLRTKRDYETAEPLLREALELHRSLYGDEHQNIAVGVNNLAGLLRMKGDLAAAEPLYQESLALRRKLYGEDHSAVGVALNNLGMFYKAKGDVEEAERYYREALAVYRNVFPHTHRRIATTLRNLGLTLKEEGRLTHAVSSLRESLAIYQQSIGKDQWLTARVQSELGACLTSLERYEEAEPLLTESYTVLNVERGVEDMYTQQTAKRLRVLYDAWGKPEKARPYQAIEIESNTSE